MSLRLAAIRGVGPDPTILSNVEGLPLHVQWVVISPLWCLPASVGRASG